MRKYANFLPWSFVQAGPTQPNLKIFRYIAGIPIAALVLFLSGSMFISKKFHVERTVFIEVSDTTAFKYAANYNLYSRWNPFQLQDASAKSIVSGTPGIDGYTVTLKGIKQDRVIVKFVDQLPYKAIYQKILLKSSFDGTYENNLFFNQSYKGTFVTWTFTGENKNLSERWKSLFYDETIGEDFQTALEKLKEELEKEQMANLVPVH